MNTQLNVKKILLGAFVFPWHYRDAFFKALIIPLLCIVAFEQGMDQIEQRLSFKYWMLFVLYLGVLTLFSVICHRLVLIDPKAVSSAPILRFGRRELRFLYWIILLSLVFMTIGLLWMLLVYFTIRYSIGGPDNLGWYVAIFLAALPASYVTARLSVLFPAIATDMEFSLKWAWRLTANNGWRLAVIVAGFPVILAAVINVLYRDQASLMETIVLSFIGTTLTAVEVVAISLAYQELIKAGENGPAT
jgi:hypothetical protein